MVSLAYASDLKPMMWPVSRDLVHPMFQPLWDPLRLYLPMWEGGYASIPTLGRGRRWPSACHLGDSLARPLQSRREERRSPHSAQPHRQDGEA